MKDPKLCMHCSAGFACGVRACRARRLWLLRTQAYAPPARNLPADCLGRMLQRRSRSGASWSPLPLCHRIWCGCNLRLCKPSHSFLDTTRFRFRRSIWRGRLFLHESHCVTAPLPPIGLFPSVNGGRRGHSHLLRRASHIPHRAQIFAVILGYLQCIASGFKNFEKFGGKTSHCG